METIYEQIYEKARPYLNTRKNDVHLSLSYGFTYRLLEYYPQADRDVVVPAIILHDVGWSAVPEERHLGAFGPNANDTDTQRLHESEGARIAAEILKSLDYDEEKIREIMAIIDGHDSRLEALSLNDRLVKDADKLWRYTPTGVDIDHVRFGIDRESYLDYLDGVIDAWFFTPEAKEMAREALAETRAK
ncbi:MAG: HD domain protein [Syntrophorhabdus sp. PtaU1.Bin002]|nr:MAG: HD domain protein [Syntrophorhabdus sp. PtaU1.Bin002]